VGSLGIEEGNDLDKNRLGNFLGLGRNLKEGTLEEALDEVDNLEHLEELSNNLEDLEGLSNIQGLLEELLGILEDLEELLNIQGLLEELLGILEDLEERADKLADDASEELEDRLGNSEGKQGNLEALVEGLCRIHLEDKQGKVEAEEDNSYKQLS
jgi:hypothetical protein